MMKKKYLLTLAMMLGMGIHALAQGNATLVLWHPGGTTTEVELYKQPRVQFMNDSVFITSTVLDMKYRADEVLRFSYKGEGTGIALPQSETVYSQEDGRLVFHGVKSTDHVALYNANGIRVPVRLSTSGDGMSLSLSSIPQGVYVLSVNGKTSKFTKK